MLGILQWKTLISMHWRQKIRRNLSSPGGKEKQVVMEKRNKPLKMNVIRGHLGEEVTTMNSKVLVSNVVAQEIEPFNVMRDLAKA